MDNAYPEHLKNIVSDVLILTHHDLRRFSRGLAALSNLSYDDLILLSTNPTENVHIRSNAADLLGELGDNRAVEILIDLLIVDTAIICYNVAGALGRIGDNRAVEPLLNALKSTYNNTNWNIFELVGVRDGIITALGNLRDKQALPFLEWVFQNDDSRTPRGQNVKSIASWAIAKIHEGPIRNPND